MIDPDLERRLADCSELMESWKRFLDLVNEAVKPPHNTSPQAEAQFLNAKARIAMLHDSFMESLKHDKGIGSNMLEIVNRCITLRLLHKLSEPEMKKMEIEWHEVFLLLNETVSGLVEEKARLAEINEWVHKSKKLKETVVVRSRSFLRSIYFKLLIAAAVIIFVIWGVPGLGIYNWDDLRDVRQLKGAIAFINKFARNQMNLHRPFIDVTEFMENLNDKVPGAGTVEDRTSDRTKEATADLLIRGMQLTNVDSSRTSDLLKKAEDFRVRSYKQDGTADSRAFVFVFWFRQTADAAAFQMMYDQNRNQVPERFSVFRRVNVIMILQADGVQVRDNVRAQAIDKVPPI